MSFVRWDTFHIGEYVILALPILHNAHLHRVTQLLLFLATITSVSSTLLNVYKDFISVHLSPVSPVPKHVYIVTLPTYALAVFMAIF